MQVDVGFGDIIYPEPEDKDIPSMLDFPKAHLNCYSQESAIAEKFQAMVNLGDANSRMKDFYDIYTLSRQFDFKGEELARAILLTFNNRKTAIPPEVDCFRREFIEMKSVQWKAFRKKLKQDHVPESFEDVVPYIEQFLVPVAQAILNGDKIPSHWQAPGPWL